MEVAESSGGVGRAGGWKGTEIGDAQSRVSLPGFAPRAPFPTKPSTSSNGI